MNRFFHLLALGLTGGALLTASPVSAQSTEPGGPCAMAADALLTQALGPAARGFQGVHVAGFDLCGVRTGTDDPIAIFRFGSQYAPGDRTPRPIDPDATLTPDHATGLVLDATPIDGVADSAMFRHLQVDGGTLASLRVERGSEIFMFNVKDGADAQSGLVALAQTVLANLPS